MKKEANMAKNHKHRRNGNPKKFFRVTSHLKSKGFKWLKDDMGFFELPENWDMEFRNDN